MTAFVSAPLSSGADARAARGAWRLPLIFLAALAWTFLVNWPFLRLEDADDGFFLEVAHLWTRGLPPYVASFDIKGPGFFAVLALVLKVFAPTLTTLKLVGVAGSAVAATLLVAITERLGRPVAVLCAAAYPILLVVNGDTADPYPPRSGCRVHQHVLVNPKVPVKSFELKRENKMIFCY